MVPIGSLVEAVVEPLEQEQPGRRVLVPLAAACPQLALYKTHSEGKAAPDQTDKRWSGGQNGEAAGAVDVVLILAI